MSSMSTSSDDIPSCLRSGNIVQVVCTPSGARKVAAFIQQNPESPWLQTIFESLCDHIQTILSSTFACQILRSLVSRSTKQKYAFVRKMCEERMVEQHEQGKDKHEESTTNRSENDLFLDITTSSRSSARQIFLQLLGENDDKEISFENNEELEDGEKERELFHQRILEKMERHFMRLATTQHGCETLQEMMAISIHQAFFIPDEGPDVLSSVNKRRKMIPTKPTRRSKKYFACQRIQRVFHVIADHFLALATDEFGHRSALFFVAEFSSLYQKSIIVVGREDGEMATLRERRSGDEKNENDAQVDEDIDEEKEEMLDEVQKLLAGRNCYSTTEDVDERKETIKTGTLEEEGEHGKKNKKGGGKASSGEKINIGLRIANNIAFLCCHPFGSVVMEGVFVLCSSVDNEQQDNNKEQVEKKRRRLENSISQFLDFLIDPICFGNKFLLERIILNDGEGMGARCIEALLHATAGTSHGVKLCALVWSALYPQPVHPPLPPPKEEIRQFFSQLLREIAEVTHQIRSKEGYLSASKIRKGALAEDPKDFYRIITHSKEYVHDSKLKKIPRLPQIQNDLPLGITIKKIGVGHGGTGGGWIWCDHNFRLAIKFFDTIISSDTEILVASLFLRHHFHLHQMATIPEDASSQSLIEENNEEIITSNKKRRHAALLDGLTLTKTVGKAFEYTDPAVRSPYDAAETKKVILDLWAKIEGRIDYGVSLYPTPPEVEPQSRAESVIRRVSCRSSIGQDRAMSSTSPSSAPNWSFMMTEEDMADRSQLGKRKKIASSDSETEDSDNSGMKKQKGLGFQHGAFRDSSPSSSSLEDENNKVKIKHDHIRNPSRRKKVAL